MSYTITNESGDQDQVATISGWSDFCDWVGGLDRDDYFEMHHLVIQGWERDLDELRDQIETAIEEEEPDDDVADIAQGIIDFLTEHEDSEIIIITNGVEPVSGDNEDEPEDDGDGGGTDDDRDGGDSARALDSSLSPIHGRSLEEDENSLPFSGRETPTTTPPRGSFPQALGAWEVVRRANARSGNGSTNESMGRIRG